jgi:hypothetical protein
MPRLSNAKVWLARALTALMLCAVLSYPSTARAGTPREAQIASLISDFISQVLYSALTGWNAPSVGTPRQRHCGESDFDQFVKYSNDYKADLAISLFRDCRFVEVIHTEENWRRRVQLKIKVGAPRNYCQSLRDVLLHVVQDIKARPERPLKPVLLKYSIFIPNKREEIRVHIDASDSYFTIKNADFEYICERGALFVDVVSQ